MKRAIIFAILSVQLSLGLAQSMPSVSPTVDIIPPDKDKLTSITLYSGSAPISCSFKANPIGAEGWNAYYEWHFRLDNAQSEPYLRRYEEETPLLITQSGIHYAQLYAKFVHGKDTIIFDEHDIPPIKITVSESKLEMPNAFSPNNDGINDIYKPKNGYQSIVEFHATIFNRWGQKLFEWGDPSQGWDGTSHRKPMKPGVYFCLVKAKGADGRVFNIKADVNLLRGYEDQTSNE